jgi:hypothetical protein
MGSLYFGDNLGTGSLQFLPQPIAYATILKITNKQ